MMWTTHVVSALYRNQKAVTHISIGTNLALAFSSNLDFGGSRSLQVIVAFVKSGSLPGFVGVCSD